MTDDISGDAYAQFCFNGRRHQGMGRRPLSPQQEKIYNLARVGWNAKQIANRLSIPLTSVYDGLHKIKTNGWDINEPTDKRHGQ